MKSNNVIVEKSHAFALRIVKLYKYLIEEKREYVLSKQIVRSGTSIGANVEEAVGGYSEKEFLSKIIIAYKEARETQYWLRLMRDSEFLDVELANSLIKDVDELLRILGSISLTMKQKLKASSQ
jgi:four helix bundle protein